MKDKIIIIVLGAFLFGGCSFLQETYRTIWGTSTRALEDARVDAISHKFNCTYDECYNAVLDLTGSQEPVDEEIDELEENVRDFTLFQQHRIRGYIVVMGVKGNVDTTEVGIFFSPIKESITRVEISSLSSSAKRRVSEILDNKLQIQFSKIK